MIETGGEGERYRELKYEKKNYITLRFRREKIKAAAAVLHPLSIKMLEDCAVMALETKKDNLMSKKLVLPHRTDPTMLHTGITTSFIPTPN